MRFASSWIPLALLALGVATASALGACSDGTGPSLDDVDGGDEQATTDGRPDGSLSNLPDGAGSETELQVRPMKTYSGVDGVRTYTVPVAVYGARAPTLEASDPTALTIRAARLAEPNGDDGVYFLVEVKKAGTFTLTAKAGGKSATASLEVATYTDAQYKLGEQRYLNDASVDGGTVRSCDSCHQGGAKIDHSPATMASATDAQLVTVIRTGIAVAGNPIVSAQGHRWTDVDDATARGLVAYLRALPSPGIVTE